MLCAFGVSFGGAIFLLFALGLQHLHPDHFPGASQSGPGETILIDSGRSWHLLRRATLLVPAEKQLIRDWYEAAGWSGFNGDTGYGRRVQFLRPVVLEHQAFLFRQPDGSLILVTTTSLVIHYR